MKLSEIRPAWQSLGCLIILTLLGAVFLHEIGIDALQQDIRFQFYADSVTYYRALRSTSQEFAHMGNLVQFSKNFLGPWVILELTQRNYYAVLCFNMLMFWAAVEIVCSCLGARRQFLYVLLLANPITLSSLLSVNKEIISLFAVAGLLYGLTKRNLWILGSAVAASFLVRWQLSLFCLMVIFAFSRFNILKEHRWRACLVLLVLASIALALLDQTIRGFNGLDITGQVYEGSGLFRMLMNAQEYGLYWLIFIPKSLHLLFGLGLRVDRLVAPNDLYNDVWQLLHSLAMLFVFVLLIITRRMQIRSDLIFISLLYLLVFVATPIYVPRYFYPIYVIWAACLALPSCSYSSKNKMMHSDSHTPGLKA